MAERHPDWLLQLIAGLAEFDDVHPKLFRSAAGDQYVPTDCPCDLLKLVPAETLAYARGWAHGREGAAEQAREDQVPPLSETPAGGVR